MASLPATFRRWEVSRFGGPDALALVERPLAAPAPGEVLLRVLATDATYTDIMILTGHYPGVFELPCTPGYACAGEVAAVGAGVAGLSPGDAVLAMPGQGCAAEYALMPARAVVRLDGEDASYVRAQPELAATLALTGCTAYQMLHRVAGAARLRAPGAAILVQAAAGGTGAMLVQLAKLAGVAPGKIVGTCSRRNLEAVRALGVEAVSYEDGDWPARARAAAGVAGFAAVFDGVALKHYAAGIALLARGGIYCAYGLTSKEAPGSVALPAAIALFAQLQARHRLLHSCFGAADALFYNVKDRRDQLADEYAEDARALVRLLASGQLQVVVGATHEFTAVQAALQAIAAGTHRGKQCVRVSAAT